MPLQLDYFNKIVQITSPTITVDAQLLHDFVEDAMASPVGALSDGANSSFFGDILKPEGKIEDPSQPGVYSQIILILNSEWQIQFYGGSGYTRIFGGKIVGGVSDQPIKATGTAGDVTVLESPVDGLTVVSGSGVTAQDKIDIVDELMTRIMEGSETFAETIRLIRAEAAGNIVKVGDVHSIRDAADSKDRIVATADKTGRTITATDGS